MKRNILLIDDNKIVTNAIETMLVSHGYNVSVANEGADGVELYFQVSPNLVLTDMEMPGISGENVIRIIKEKNQTKLS